VHSVKRPWWQQATALVTVTTGGVITGFNFVPGAAATMTSPTSVPLHLLALEQAAQPGAAMNARAVGGDSADSGTSDALLRSAIVNVAKYYLQIAGTRSPAQMEALIWDNTSLNGADHGPSCAAFASLTLELAAQAVGQQSWVSGGSSYPFPLPAWADVRVDTNPASTAITSVMADAQAHDRWHPLGRGYQPEPGDWVLFGHHVEVVTRYSGGVLETIGADSEPGLTVNAHSYSGTLAADGVVGFVDNGHLGAAGAGGSTAAPRAAATPTAAAAADKPSAVHAPPAATPKGSEPSATATARPASGKAGAAGTGTGGQAVVPGIAQQVPAGATETSGTGSDTQATPQQQAPAGGGHGGRSPASTASGSTAAVPGVVEPASASITAGSGAGSGTQSVDDRGHAAAIPGASGSGGASTTSASAGVAAVPGASPAAVAPASHQGASPSGHAAAATPAGSAAVPGSAPSPSASAAATPAATAKPAATPAPTATATPTAAAAPSATSAPTSTAKPEHYRQYAPASQATPGTRTQQAFISLISPGAVAAQQRWGVPAAVTIAQAIEESSWGNSQLAAQYHNLFGIKGSGPAGSVGLPTSEFYSGQWVTIDAQFRVYHNVAESIADHAELLATSGYYQRAMADRAVPDAFANDLTGVYATDPDYGANLIAIMKLYNLYRFDGPVQSAQPQAAQASASATSTPVALPGATHSQPTATQPAAGQANAGDGSVGGHPADRAAAAGQATIPGLGAPALAPAVDHPTAAAHPTANAHGTAGGHATAGAHATPGAADQSAATIPGVVAPDGVATGASAAAPGATGSAPASTIPGASASAAPRATATGTRSASPHPTASATSNPTPSATASADRGVAAIPGLAATAAVNYQRQPAAATTAARYQPQFTTAMTTAYFATAKGPLGHGEHLYRDVAGQTGLRWELLAACDWMQCKAHPRYSPVHGEKIGALNSDGTSYPTKSAALGQCASDLIELAAAVYGIDLTARRLLSVRALADAFAAFRWGALLLRHGVSAMEFPYSVAGLTAQHQKMHWPVINDPAAPDRPGARFREPFGAVPVVLSLDYPATVLTDRQKAQATPCPGSFPGSDAGPTPPLARWPLPPLSR
jgi:flagellum-specific peptidoglycan hydrolase FlgJ